MTGLSRCPPAGTLSAAGRTAGFTLLELMVVMVLIGIIFSFAVLSMRGDDVAELMAKEAGRLQTLLALASDEAIVRGEELGVRFGEDGYEFLLLAQEGWQRPDDGLLRAYTLPADIELRFAIDDEEALESGSGEPGDDPPPQVVILSSGEMTPFTVSFSSPLSEHGYRLSATLLGEVTHEREDTR